MNNSNLISKIKKSVNDLSQKISSYVPSTKALAFSAVVGTLATLGSGCATLNYAPKQVKSDCVKYLPDKTIKAPIVSGVELLSSGMVHSVNDVVLADELLWKYFPATEPGDPKDIRGSRIAKDLGKHISRFFLFDVPVGIVGWVQGTAVAIVDTPLNLVSGVYFDITEGINGETYVHKYPENKRNYFPSEQFMPINRIMFDKLNKIKFEEFGIEIPTIPTTPSQSNTTTNIPIETTTSETYSILPDEYLAQKTIKEDDNVKSVISQISNNSKTESTKTQYNNTTPIKTESKKIEKIITEQAPTYSVKVQTENAPTYSTNLKVNDKPKTEIEETKNQTLDQQKSKKFYLDALVQPVEVEDTKEETPPVNMQKTNPFYLEDLLYKSIQK